MFGELENPWVLLMFFIMFLWLLITFLHQRLKGKKEHHYDERYHYKSNRAKAKAWDFMLIIILISMPIVLVVEGGLFSYFFLMALFILHMLSMAIAGLYFQMKDSN
ncbi:DUF3796 domain-containing protein [Ornithinibacillus californiensis]|uniref:DUF3796 domain-containing protein n=1 Tax=Ornithinibacillus californiensis TaxID=161536 RepID=UPI00069D9579|nr:DUF3796 domain-containing protein [Ornithinibacillus californiensis]